MLIATLYNTGARVSEAIELRVSDFARDRAILKLRGKGRKERVVPLWKSTVRLLTAWVDHRVAPSDAPLLPNHSGGRMTRSGVTYRLRLAATKGAALCPSLGKKRISPHALRHTTAMHLLQAGVDITLIALWLGHESPTTTHRYVEADLAMKERALARLHEPEAKLRRYRAPDSLIDFLRAL